MKETLEAASSAVISTMETYFHRHGRLVASYPITTILASVAICGVFGIGLVNFHEEKNMVRLWLPQVMVVEVMTEAGVGLGVCGAHHLAVAAWAHGLRVQVPGADAVLLVHVVVVLLIGAGTTPC